MTVIGYARVSLDEMNPALQLDALRAAGAERVYVEHATGATMSRPQLQKALDGAQAGDVLAVWRLDRLGRSMGDLISQVNQLAQRGIEFRSLSETIDTTTPSGRLTFHIFGAFAQFEREVLIDRTKAGLAAARASGKPVGRPRLVTHERAITARELRDTGLSLRAIGKHLRVSQATVARLLVLAS